MSRFTDRLWREIVREHGAELRGMERPQARPHHRAKRVLAGTGLVGVAAAGVALAVAIGAAGTTPAFAVTRNNDGSYSVGIRSWSAIPAANARLRALGLRARLVGVESGCTNAAIRILPSHVVVTAPGGATALADAKAQVAAARIDPAKIPPGRMLVVPAIHAQKLIRLAPGKAVGGKVPSCLPPPAQVCIAPAAASATTGTGTATTGTGTTTTGTGREVGPTGSFRVPRAVPGAAIRCFAPPPMFCRVARSGAAAGSGSTSTSGTTTTAPGSGTTTTATTTTGSGAGPTATPLRGVRACPGPPLPPCMLPAGGSGRALAPAQVAALRAKGAAVRARAAALRAVASEMRAKIAKLQAATAAASVRVQVPAPQRAMRLMAGPGALRAAC